MAKLISLTCPRLGHGLSQHPRLGDSHTFPGGRHTVQAAGWYLKRWQPQAPAERFLLRPDLGSSAPTLGRAPSTGQHGRRRQTRGKSMQPYFKTAPPAHPRQPLSSQGPNCAADGEAALGTCANAPRRLLPSQPRPRGGKWALPSHKKQGRCIGVYSP